MAEQPTPSEIQWMEEHVDDTLVPNILACCITCGVLSVGVVILRVWARRLLHRRLVLEANDYLLIAGWVFYMLYLVGLACTIRYGAGRHVVLVTDPRMLQVLTIIVEVAYYPSMGFIKFSILQLYSTIFPQQDFLYMVWGVAAFVAAWFVTGPFVGIFQCTPIRYAWDPSIKGGHCVNYGRFVLIAVIFNILTDFAILLMPIPLVWRLRISKQKRYLVIFTFAMGSSACIVSIVRLGYSLKLGTTWDGSWENATPALVVSAELLVALLAASIPTYRPVWRFFTNTSPSTYRMNEMNMDYLPPAMPANQAEVSLGNGVTAAQHGDGIYVTNSVELTRQTRRSGTRAIIQGGQSYYWPSY